MSASGAAADAGAGMIEALDPDTAALIRLAVAVATGGRASASGPSFGEGPLDWRESGERTCQVVYGDNYGRLRENVRALHPALDAWMITDGYGWVLARPGASEAR